MRQEAYTFKQLMSVSGVARSTLFRLAKEGKLKVRAGRKYKRRITHDDAMAFLRSLEAKRNRAASSMYLLDPDFDELEI